MINSPSSPRPSAFYAGIRLFNAGHYWHAHEQWEACWLVASGDDAHFYQALIQTAAALVKWQQGNQRGLGLNWAKSRRRLVTLPPHYAGLDLVALRLHMERFAAGEALPPPRLALLNAQA